MSAIQTAPVSNSSASVEARARAVQERLTEQRRPYKPAAQVAKLFTAPAAEAPADNPSSEAVPSSAKDSLPAEADQSQRDYPEESLSSDAAAVKQDDTPPAMPSASQTSTQPSNKQSKVGATPGDFSGNAKQPDSAADVLKANVPPASQAALAASATSEPSAETGSSSAESDAGSAESAPSSADKLSTASDAEQSGMAGTADSELERKAEGLHDLGSASSAREDEVPDALQTLDSNLRDQPEPDVTRPGPKLFQSAPETATSTPTPQTPQNPGGVHPKQDTAAQHLQSRPLKPASDVAPTAERPSTLKSSDGPQGSGAPRRQPLAELQPESVSGRSAAPSQTDTPADAPIPAAAQPGASAVQSSRGTGAAPAAKEEVEDDASTSAAAPAPGDRQLSSSQGPGAARPGEEEQGEEDAAQLRERMQQLRQAMLDQQAALTAAEAASQPARQRQQQQQQQPGQVRQQQQQPQQQVELAEAKTQESSKLPVVSEPEQQQQKDLAAADKQDDPKLQTVNEPNQQQAELKQTKAQGVSQPQAATSQHEKGQQDQTSADARPRVLPRPSSGDSATIFVERPDTDSDLRSHPIDLDQSDDREVDEQGIDLVALAAGACLNTSPTEPRMHSTLCVSAACWVC